MRPQEAELGGVDDRHERQRVGAAAVGRQEDPLLGHARFRPGRSKSLSQLLPPRPLLCNLMPFISPLQARFQAKDLEQLYKRYEQRTQLGKFAFSFGH